MFGGGGSLVVCWGAGKQILSLEKLMFLFQKINNYVHVILQRVAGHSHRPDQPL